MILAEGARNAYAPFLPDLSSFLLLCLNSRSHSLSATLEPQLIVVSAMTSKYWLGVGENCVSAGRTPDARGETFFETEPSWKLVIDRKALAIKISVQGCAGVVLEQPLSR